MPLTPNAPLIISIVAAVISGMSLGWNIYKEVAFKARIKLYVHFLDIFNDPSNRVPTPFVAIEVTNHGPGKVIINGMWMQNKSASFGFRKKKSELLYVLPGVHPAADKMPARLDVAESAKFVINLVPKGIFTKPITHIGVQDSFGRFHWCTRKEVNNMFARYATELRDKPLRPIDPNTGLYR